MDIKPYIEEIILWGGAAIAALGGSSISVSAIAAWVKRQITKAVEKLFEQKVDYSAKVEELNRLSAKFLEAEGQLATLQQKYNEQSENFDELVKLSQNLLTHCANLERSIYIIASNNPYMVANGTAGDIAGLLGMKETAISDDEAVHEDEVDG